MISPALRAFLTVIASAYGVLGAILYLAPVWASGHFAWRVSPFVAMTIGGWCLGTAFAAFVVVRRRSWPAMLSPIVYLALFGLFETGVLYAFRANVLLNHPLAWLYAATIIATGLFAIAAAVEGARTRGLFKPLGAPMGSWTVFWAVIFVLLVGFLGLYGLLAVPGMRGLNRGIFPELLSPFSLRAFGSFYLALAVAVIPLLITRGLGNLLNHAFAMYSLLVLISAAAFVYIGQFDFANRPTQLTYIGIYLAVGALVGLYLLRYGTGAEGKKA
jgi:hypothetical protein